MLKSRAGAGGRRQYWEESARLLGMDADDSIASRAREWMESEGNATQSAPWGKFLLALIGLYDYRGVLPVPPELWIIPRWLPIHPSRLWCHSRMVYLPMSYLYGRRDSVEMTPFLRGLRSEIFADDPEKQQDWSTRALEFVLYGLAWCLRMVTYPFGIWTLTGALAPIGAAAMMAVPSVRRRALRNLELVWPEKSDAERRAIANGAARQFTRLAAEYAHLDRFLEVVELDVSGQEHIRAAKEAGRGAVLVTAHYGNWEAARLAAMREGCETGIIYRAFNNRYLDRFTLDLIPKAGNPVLQKGRQGMRRLVTHVAKGGFVMILVDQRNSAAPWIDFMGHPAETVTAAADLARRLDAALIPVQTRRDVENRRFEIRFEAPIETGESVDMMEAVNARIGAWVEQDPAQWFWFHRRWRGTYKSVPRPGETED